MSLLGRIFSSSKGGGWSSKGNTRDSDRHVDNIEADQKTRQPEPDQVKREGSDSDKELERWAAEDDKDVKRR